MHEIYELKEKLLDELGDYAQNGKFSEDDAKNIKNLAGAVDHICNILMDAEEEEYSGQMGGNMGGMSYQRGGQGGGSNRGGSYARGNGRGRGSNARRDSMGRYSSERGYSRAAQDMAEELRMLMDEPRYEPVRHDIERLLRKVEQM